MAGHTFVIGEAASTHDGDLKKALALIDQVANAGCDAVKFQFWSDAEKLAQRRKAPQYLESYLKYRMPRNWLDVLAVYAEKAGVEFMVTSYYTEDLAIIAPYVLKFKIAGFESQDRPFVEAHRPYNKQILATISMGGSKIERATNLYSLQAYPPEADQLNLACIRHFDGFSDNGTKSPIVAALAVAYGAQYIEVHTTLDSTDPENPDASVGCNGPLLRKYVRYIRSAEKLSGNDIPKLQPCEEMMTKYQVKS